MALPDDLDPLTLLNALLPPEMWPSMRQAGVVLPLAVMNEDQTRPGLSVGWSGGGIPAFRDQTPLWFAQGLVPGTHGAEARRWLAQCNDVVAVVADDIGEKAVELPGVQPFARLMTKPGSYQLIYAFTELAVPMKDAQTLQDILIGGGWTEPKGNNGIRLARLPGSHPPGKAAAARLTELAGARYPIADLIQWARDQLPPEKRNRLDLAASHAPGSPGALPEGLTGTADEIGKRDLEFGFLRRRGDVFGLSGGGPWWNVRCPWWREHRDADPHRHSTVAAHYLPLPGGGRFKCHRGDGHVAKRAANRGFHTETALFRQWADHERLKERTARK